MHRLYRILFGNATGKRLRSFQGSDKYYQKHSIFSSEATLLKRNETDIALPGNGLIIIVRLVSRASVGKL